MNNYCRNCGKKLTPDVIECPKCGLSFNKKSKSITSMFLGIIILLYSIMNLTVYESAHQIIVKGIADAKAEGMPHMAAVIMAAISYTLISTVVSVIAFSIACSDRKTQKNTQNSVGYYTSAITMALCVISFIWIIIYYS